MWNCDKCYNTFKDPIHSENQRKLKGCNGLANFRYSVENIKYATCPGNYTTPVAWQLFDIFSLYDTKGVLPEGNSSLDMTYKFSQIFGIISSIRERHRKKVEKDGKSSNRSNRRR